MPPNTGIKPTALTRLFRNVIRLWGTLVGSVPSLQTGSGLCLSLGGVPVHATLRRSEVENMEAANIVREIASLPPEAQRQVMDFVAFLRARYPTTQPVRKTRRTKLANEPFIGMWRDREDMQDSTAWVRSLRQREWERSV